MSCSAGIARPVASAAFEVWCNLRVASTPVTPGAGYMYAIVLFSFI
jgi:hypothetical protein